uniref:Uncharacterized protein n=1 Tax=Arundo donax TaxID=35708 RepID=A0A0A9FAW3_ARUDO
MFMNEVIQLARTCYTRYYRYLINLII